jgi:hypothetical protein
LWIRWLSTKSMSVVITNESPHTHFWSVC